MAREFKTRGELQKLVLDEARASGKCADPTEIVITGPFPSREFTWDIMRTQSRGRIRRLCQGDR